MKKQTSNSTVLGKSYPDRHDFVSDGSQILISNSIKKNTLVFRDGSLLSEGLENDYLIKDGEIEFMYTPDKLSNYSLLTF